MRDVISGSLWGLKKAWFPWTQVRPMIQFIKDKYKFPTPKLGCEIGVDLGVNAKSILDTLNIRKLYLVDPYVAYDGYDDDNRTFASLHECKMYAHSLLRKYSDKVVWMENYSHLGLDNISDDLDFVYIDANHDYEYVKRDIGLYYDKLCKGGILGGDDYNATYINEVNKAVNEFVKEHGLELMGHASDWWVVK